MLNAGKSVAPGRMVAELHFGFWTGFFNKVHARTGLGHAVAAHAFPHAPRAERDLRKRLASALKSAWTLTFFGYGAPKTDVEAIQLLKKGWGDPQRRFLEETEIIDIRPEDDLTSTWNPFIHSHHYGIHRSFYDSNIAKHPRRSCEALWERVAEARFIEKGDDFPKDMNFESLYNWLQPRITAELGLPPV